MWKYFTLGKKFLPLISLLTKRLTTIIFQVLNECLLGMRQFFLPNINAYYRRDVFGEMLLKMLIKQNFIDVREMFLFSSKLIETISLLAGFSGGKYF